MSLNKDHINSQKGSVLFLILIGVALFAALSYVASTMMRGSGNIGDEKTGIHISEVLTYARSVKEALHVIRIANGCADNQISFERSPFDGSDADYVNASAPANFSCHVFHRDGGGIALVSPLLELSAYEYFFTGSFVVTGFGSDSSGELSMVLRDLNQSQCELINTRLGLGAPQTDTAASINFYTVEFVGTYSAEDGIGTGIGTGNALYNGKAAGCFYEDSATSGEYFFYQVLLAR